ncbi:hypothetical protein ACWGLG_17010 [Streptomyces antimycoticus]
MVKSRTARGVKGALVSAAAAIVCYWVWASLLEWADDVAEASGPVMGAGWFEGLLALITGFLSMPVLLWVGMRLLGERGNHLLVLAGAVAWLIIGGHVADGFVSVTTTAALLTLFAVLGGLLSLVELPGE